MKITSACGGVLFNVSLPMDVCRTLEQRIAAAWCTSLGATDPTCKTEEGAGRGVEVPPGE